MPCFEPLVGETDPTDSPDYQRTLERTERAKHIIHVYLRLNGIGLPDGATPPTIRADVPASPTEFSLDQVTPQLVHKMAQHCLCDGLHFIDLHTMASVLYNLPSEAPYRAILLAIGNAMRKPASEPYSNEYSGLLDPAKYLRMFPQFEPADSPDVKHCSASRQDSLPRRWLKLSEDCLTLHNLPADHSYPLLDSLLGPDSLAGLRWSHLLYSLMAYLERKPAARAKYGKATTRLSQLIQANPPNQDTVNNLSYGPRLEVVDLSGHLLTLQGSSYLLVALTDLGGKLAFHCYEPLCLAATDLLHGYCIEPAADGTICLRENHWEYAKDQHADLLSQHLKPSEGYAYRTCWEFGLGIDCDQEKVEPWFQFRTKEPIPPAQIWSQLAVAKLYGGKAFHDSAE